MKAGHDGITHSLRNGALGSGPIGKGTLNNSFELARAFGFTTPAPVYSPSMSRLIRLLHPYRIQLAAAALLATVSAVAVLSLPVLFRNAFDKVIQTQSLDILDQSTLGGFSLILLAASTSFTGLVLLSYAGNRIVRDLRFRLFAHLQRLPVVFFDRARTGVLSSYLHSYISVIQETLVDGMVQLVGNLVTVFGGLGIALVIDPLLTGIVIILIASLIGLLYGLGRRLRRLTRRALDATAAVFGAMSEALANIRLVKAFARERFEDSQADEGLATAFRLWFHAGILQSALQTIGGIGALGILLSVVWYGGRDILSGHGSAGSLLAFSMTMIVISGPMTSLIHIYGRLQQATGAADRLFAILDEPPEVADPPDAVPFPQGPGHVTYEHVDFAYSSECPVLCGLSLDIPAGRITALVGPSGSGKTTLAMLLYRFYEPQAGSIRIDNVAVDRIALRDLREWIGLVPQEPILFHGTVRENIRFGRLEASDSEVMAAAESANVAEFAVRLPQRYETIVGEARRCSLGRAVPADRHRPGNPQEPTHPDFGRGNVCIGHKIRDTYSRGTRASDARPHDYRHRTPPVDYSRRRPNCRAGQGRVVERGDHNELLAANGQYALLQRLAMTV